jgi:dihydroneopterin aldolase
MAERLKAIAEQSGIDAIAELAEDLHQRIADDAPWTETLQLCSELLDLCRQTQHAYTSFGTTYGFR